MFAADTLTGVKVFIIRYLAEDTSVSEFKFSKICVVKQPATTKNYACQPQNTFDHSNIVNWSHITPWLKHTEKWNQYSDL